MDFLQTIMAAGAGVSQGQVGGDMISELRKALTSGYGTDVTTLTGAGAFRIQSLDRTMKATIQENKHFKLFNALQKANATATVDEWTEQDQIGGFLGGSTNTETGVISGAVGNYNRRAAFVKFLMTRREVSFVSTLGNNIVQSEAIEARNGALQLLTDAEFLCYEGDSSVVPTEFDSIDKQIYSLGDSSHVINSNGASLYQLSQINQAVRVIVGMGNFGTPTDLFCSNGAQADFDNAMDPAARVNLVGMDGKTAIEKGSPVSAIRTSWGPIKLNPAVFIRDEDSQMPFQANANAQYQAVAAAQAGLQPATLTAVAAAGGASSMWAAPQAGQYYYMVCGVNSAGESTGIVSSAVTVAAGNGVTLTIGQSAGGLETGYTIYRSRLNGTNAPSDLRKMVRIPRTGASTVYVDLNQDIPGSTRARLLSMSPGGDAIAWRQLLPMTKFQLYATQAATIPWAQLLFGYLRLGKRKQHVLIKNIVTSSQVWRPFG